MNNKIIFSFKNNKKLALEVAKNLSIEVGRIYKKRFADGEIMIKSGSDVKDKDVIIIQSTSKNVNEELFSLLLLLDSVKRSGAKSITLFMPYFAYSRQERVSWNNEPISCQVVANIIDTAYYDKLVCFDLHHPVIETFFKKPIINKPTTALFSRYYDRYFKAHNIAKEDVVIVCPDHGANVRAEALAKALGNIKMVVLDKVRKRANCAEHLEIKGDEVKGKVCIIIDDIIDTGGTLISATNLLKRHGSTKILVAASHPVLSNHCYQKLVKAGIDDVVVTNSIEKQLHKDISVVDLLPLIEEEI